MTPFDLWQLGLNVLPVPRPDEWHDGKRPISEWREWQTTRQERGDVARMFNMVRWVQRPNVAIITGAVSGVVVIDLDDREAITWAKQSLPQTPWMVNTAKGYHLYYRHPGYPVANRARLNTGNRRLAVDIRGDGGYVIGPGSVHKTGHVYTATREWKKDDVLPVLPAWLLERPAPPPVSVPVNATGDAVERARRYLAAVPSPVIGCGSDALTFAMACRLVRGFGLDEDAAGMLLTSWAPSFDAWWIAQKVRSAMRHGKEPVGGMLGEKE